MPIHRFSSRRQNLGRDFLAQRLHNARSYDRIAGYFRSSLFDVIGDALETVSGPIRVVCNSDLQLEDVQIAQQAMRREWCASQPETHTINGKPQLARLYEFLRSGRMKVKVLPYKTFGLEHGKAGVITCADGHTTSFLGSANESLSAWQTNYELLWEDDSPESVQWVQAEFDYLWNHPTAVWLAEFVIEDIGRLSRRTVLPSIEDWRENPDPAAPVIEMPIYRQEYGLWEHQKYFINKAFQAHQGPYGARFVLADMVGLGKTVQLAIAGMLMALHGDKPILVIAPKALLWQWQSELRDLLDMPSAVWNGRQWVDEHRLEHPAAGPQQIKKCPRRVGIISQGLVTRGSEVVGHLKAMSFECIIVDEAHRARRKNLAPGKEGHPAQPNNLLAFLHDIAPRTISLLLATATPVQVNPVEAWDLLSVLAGGNQFVLGDSVSPWRQADQALEVVMGRQALPQTGGELWRWLRNPLPLSSEGPAFANIRKSLHMADTVPVAKSEWWDQLKGSDRQRVDRIGRTFAEEHNPFIRHIIRRTRTYLEETIDPETGSSYLKKIEVVLHGERDEDSIQLPPYLREAYTCAEEFCDLLAERERGTGFLKTLLLRRLGSSIHAGLLTAQKMLNDWADLDDEEDEDAAEDEETASQLVLTAKEREKLQSFVSLLAANQEPDPKHAVVQRLLLRDRWLERGCIIFSQYYDSIWSLAQQLSEALPQERIGMYAGGHRSGIVLAGVFEPQDREILKHMVQRKEIRLLLGTDAASEGLNLQRLGSLINLDLPWNPTRLEQRKGRIQRIGQRSDRVEMYNMRYQDSVEDRVHQLLSERLESIYTLFGQLPDILEDVWIAVAQRDDDRARQTIDAVPTRHPFEDKYHRVGVENVHWESCAHVLSAADRRIHLTRGW